MNIRFEILDECLVLFYQPDTRDVASLVKQLKDVRLSEYRYPIKSCFWVTYDDLYPLVLIDDYIEDANSYFTDTNEVAFCVGFFEDGYIKFNSAITKTVHDFFFVSNIPFRASFFVKDNYISILKGIDRVIENDLYVDIENLNTPNHITFEYFQYVVNNFPGTTELRHYSNMRLSAIFADLEDNSAEYLRKYDKFIATRKSVSRVKTLNETHPQIISSSLFEGSLYKLEQFKVLLSDFDTRLNKEQHDESFWQEYVHNIIPFLFPKYIVSIREIVFDKIDEVEDEHNRKPDFILIDTSGFVDVMDIKVPEIELISNKVVYRNNHYPLKSFSGSVVQVEKYIYCLNQAPKINVKKIIEKSRGLLPEDIKVRIINPIGLLIAGRSPNSDVHRLRDFELIKRQYKNVVEIMTYDDILNRLKNITVSLERDIRSL